MKVLFLDIDGVLNNAQTNFKSELWPLERYMAFLVGKIQLDTGCEVVLSSSWRHHPEAFEVLEKRVVKMFDRTPFSGELKEIPQPYMRGYEIEDWLNRHPEVERYAILDDDSDMLESQKPNFFKTDWQTGLTEEIANAVTIHLNS